VVNDYGDDELAPLVQNLGGHDLGVLIDSYRRCDAVTDRPSVVFAYTVKGWGLPFAGDPLNHAALLSPQQVDELRESFGLTSDTEWDRFADDSPEGALCRSVGGELNNRDPVARPVVPVPASVGGRTGATAVSTQETFGRLLTRLADIPDVAERMVTASPDVSVSTNLGGWINKMGVFNPAEQPDFLGDERLLRWKQTRRGHHVELGISEMNLFLLLHALGLGHELHGEHLLPIGTVYDPFVCRGLDAFVYALYNGARFVVVGTPAGMLTASGTGPTTGCGGAESCAPGSTSNTGSGAATTVTTDGPLACAAPELGVARTRISTVPASGNTTSGLRPSASSNCPSPSRSHATAATGSSARTVPPADSTCRTRAVAVYGPPASTAGI
jgi:pyruvate dehydrogenase E1 component